MKILVNKCPDTGSLFECDKQFKNHRAKLSRAQRAQEKQQQELTNARLEIDKIRGLLTDPADLSRWFIQHQTRLIELYNRVKQPWDSQRFYPTDSFTKVASKMVYDDCVSNTHHCPDGGVTNWGWSRRNNGLPTGYPGWRGDISGALVRDKRHMSSYPTTELLEFYKIKTGSGGGGNESWRFEAHLFLDDWPSLRPLWDDMKQSQLIKTIIDCGPRASLPYATC